MDDLANFKGVYHLLKIIRDFVVYFYYLQIIPKELSNQRTFTTFTVNLIVNLSRKKGVNAAKLERN